MIEASGVTVARHMVPRANGANSKRPSKSAAVQAKRTEIMG